jgi:hypothetical protein
VALGGDAGREGVVSPDMQTRHGTEDALEAVEGRYIAHVRLDTEKNEILVEFNDGSLRITDDGQNCCEHRYITTDDELPHFSESLLLNVEIREVPSLEDEYETHEIAFLVLHTNKGDLTFETHNKHNGYYGGFILQAVWTP